MEIINKKIYYIPIGFLTALIVLFSATLSINGQTPPADNKEDGIRLKDLARISGVRGNQLMGYGLVVGLPGSGDTRSALAKDTMINLLETMGISPDSKTLNAKNTAAVIVTAEIPPYAASGDRLNATVSSVGDARSLQGGVLIQTPLYGGDREIYAVAQGTVATGNVAASGNGKKSNSTVGMILNGVFVEKQVPLSPVDASRVQISLHNFDFSTLDSVRDAIVKSLDNPVVSVEGGSLYVNVPETSDPVDLIAKLESVRIIPTYPARVVINERTGTIVMGGDVRIDPVAVSRGNMSLELKPKIQDWRTMGIYAKNGDGGKEANPDSEVLREVSAANVQEVISALNALGADLKDIIAILQALKDSGALHAELIIM